MLPSWKMGVKTGCCWVPEVEIVHIQPILQLLKVSTFWMVLLSSSWQFMSFSMHHFASSSFCHWGPGGHAAFFFFSCCCSEDEKGLISPGWNTSSLVTSSFLKFSSSLNVLNRLIWACPISCVKDNSKTISIKKYLSRIHKTGLIGFFINSIMRLDFGTDINRRVILFGHQTIRNLIQVILVVTISPIFPKMPKSCSHIHCAKSSA